MDVVCICKTRVDLCLSYRFYLQKAFKLTPFANFTVFKWEATSIGVYKLLKLIFLLLPVIDCLLSDWGTWSDCDAVCGTGIMTRTRTIESAPQNGGKHCSSLVQKRGCQGFKCQHHQDRRILRGMFDY